ncbi:SGNH/GDSL hydrolase family protein [Aquimarina sp. 2201CG5-10]|nr:SGNH/GDSL hydrolase family protein [Aquimarina sp. 2201CG5-10]
MEHDKMFEFDNTLGWKFIPNKTGAIVYSGEARHYIKTNEIGFRDASLPNSLNNKKVLVLGDSFVSNISVKDDEVFTEVMEQKLEDNIVLNFGVNGYGQIQEYLLLQQWLPKINPDLIILMIYIRNDFTDNLKNNDWLYSRPSASWNKEKQVLEIHPISNFEKKKKRVSTKFYHKLHVYHLIRTKINNIKNKFDPSEQINSISYTPPELYLCRSELSESTQLMYVIMENILLKISDYAKKSNTPLVFALAPSIVQVQDELWESTLSNADRNQDKYKRSLPNDKLMNFAKKNDLHMIDLLPILRLERSKGEKLYNSKEQHWTAMGNKVVANTILEYLTQKSLIE